MNTFVLKAEFNIPPFYSPLTKSKIEYPQLLVVLATFLENIRKKTIENGL